MKRIIPFITLIALWLCSCASIRVETDHDSRADFNNIRTFAFHKEAVDAVKISDLDKKRILRFIEEEMQRKGFSLSQNPDILVSFATEEKATPAPLHTTIGWGWGPFYTNTTFAETQVEGLLYINIIRAAEQDLIWQGKGNAILQKGQEREKRIEEFVKNILAKFPPEKKNN